MTFFFTSDILVNVAEVRRQNKTEYAGMAELADAQASGACGRKIVWVQVPSPALFYCIRSWKRPKQKSFGRIFVPFLDKVHKKEKNVIEKM